MKRSLNFWEKIKLSLEMRKVKMKIKEAKKKNNDVINLEYCISKSAAKKLNKEGYEVKTGCMCSFGKNYKYTVIIL